MKKLVTLLTGVMLLVSSQWSLALSPEEVRAKILEARPGLPIGSLKESVLPGFYEAVLTDGAILYVAEDGNHFIAGDLYRVDPGGLVNVTEESQNVVRRELLQDLDESQMVVFAPAKGLKRARITVFTDIDCGYCRKLHQEIPELNRLGIEVRYLAYPRAGVDSTSYNKIVSAWCAENPQLSLTKAKLGQEIEEKTCENPVAAQYALGGEFGVTGTPAIVFDDGRIQMGYSPANQLAARMGLN